MAPLQLGHCPGHDAARVALNSSFAFSQGAADGDVEADIVPRFCDLADVTPAGQASAAPTGPSVAGYSGVGLSLLHAALSWSRRPQGTTADGNDTSSAVVDAELPVGSDQGRAFDIADCVEKGVARETTTDFMGPLRRSRRLSRFRVVRSEDRLEHRLFTDNGDFLMFARLCIESQSIGFFMYDPAVTSDRALFDPAKPAFALTFNRAKSDWLLVQDRCESCHFVLPHLSCSALGGRQQVASIQHSRRAVGDGVSNEMGVRVPGLYSDNSRVVWCPARCRVGLAHVADGDTMTQVLVTKRPAWNKQAGCLVLDFAGRDILSSAKNFQLALRQKPDHVICQHGKLSSSVFALDARFPLSIIQAFAIAMSTVFWT